MTLTETLFEDLSSWLVTLNRSPILSSINIVQMRKWELPEMVSLAHYTARRENYHLAKPLHSSACSCWVLPSVLIHYWLCVPWAAFLSVTCGDWPLPSDLQNELKMVCVLGRRRREKCGQGVSWCIRKCVGLVVWPQAGRLASLNLVFLIYKIGITITLTSLRDVECEVRKCISLAHSSCLINITPLHVGKLSGSRGVEECDS